MSVKRYAKYPILVLVITTLAIAVAASMQVSPTQRALVTNYQALLKSADAGTAGRIEAAYNAVGALDKNLDIESLADVEFEQLKRDLPGTDISRVELRYIKPIPEYFSKLAEKHGDPADRQFFAALMAVHPGIVSPIYKDSVTDYSVCAIFGDGKMLNSYRVWSRFQHDFPNRYIDATQEQLEDVSETLLSTCPCGDLGTVRRELDQFLKDFPTSPLRIRVEERLRALSEGKSGIREHCSPG
jgi:hypothetical protein